MQLIKQKTSTTKVSSGDGHPFNIDIDIESPPLVLYGPPSESSGALLSGLLTLEVKAPNEPHKSKSRPDLLRTVSSLSMNSTKAQHSVKSLTLSLVQMISYAQPFQPHQVFNCQFCNHRTVELARWEIIKEKQAVPVGHHKFPFSHLLSGKLPHTCSLGTNSNTTIKYELVCELEYTPGNKKMVLVMPISVTRSIIKGPDRNSLRVFPPTEVTATAVLPNVIYPKSSFPLELKLDGIVADNKRWRMRRLGWRIEEKVRVKTYSCQHHASKVAAVEKATREKQAKDGLPNDKKLKRNVSSPPTIHHLVLASDLSQVDAGAVLSPHQSNRPRDMDVQLPDEDNIPMVHPADHANEDENIEVAPVSTNVPDCLYTEEIRNVSHGELKNGWKSDFNGLGKIELISEINCMGLNSGVTNPHIHSSTKDHPLRPITSQSSAKSSHSSHIIPHGVNVSCDMEDPVLGIYVSHVLVVEVVVAEEVVQGTGLQPSTTNSSINPSKSSADQRLAELSPMFLNHNAPHPVEDHSITPMQSLTPVGSKAAVAKGPAGVPTGAARVLRMQFRLNVTERSGLGIAWDDEVPPTYGDVRLLSPPTYEQSLPCSPIYSPAATPARVDSTLNLAPPQLAHLNSMSLFSTLSSQSDANAGYSGLDDRIM